MEIVTDEVRKARELYARRQAYKEHQQKLIKQIDIEMKKDPMPGESINTCKVIRRNIHSLIRPIRRSRVLIDTIEHCNHVRYLKIVNDAIKFKQALYFELCQFQADFRWSKYYGRQA